MNEAKSKSKRAERTKLLRECAVVDEYVGEIMKVAEKIIAEKNIPLLFDILRSYDSVVKEASENKIGDVSLCEKELPFWAYKHNIVKEARQKMEGSLC